MPEQKESWHLDKRVPVLLIVTILAQTATAGWFAAMLTARVNVLERDMEREHAINTVQAELIRDIEMITTRQDEKLENILAVVERTDRRIELIERNQTLPRNDRYQQRRE